MQRGCATAFPKLTGFSFCSQSCRQHLQIQRFPGNVLGFNVVPIEFLESMNRTGLFSVLRSLHAVYSEQAADVMVLLSKSSCLQ